MRRLILVGLLAFAVALTGTAYAEVQNIKVSGDIDMKAVTHNNYDLKAFQKNRSPGGGGGMSDSDDSNDDNENFTLSTVHVSVAADLTDNVSASVRLLNQRKWDSHAAGIDQISLDNAYVTLKEFLYSPLTVIAGRQNLNYGNGFVVGDGSLLADPDAVFSTSGVGGEYSAYNAFDAVRAILDFAPVTVEGVWAKVNETNVAADDESLYGAVVNYKLDRWSAEVEPYWFYKDIDGAGRAGTTITVNGATSNGGARAYEVSKTHTVGVRLAASPIENLKWSGELAHQLGYLRDTNALGAGGQKRNRSAWGASVYANYTWAKVPWTPATGVGWDYYSGEQARGTKEAADGTDRKDVFNAWDPVYRGYHTAYIQDFFSGADAPANLYTTIDANDTGAGTNRHLIYGDVLLSPMKDVKLWARYTHVRFDKAPRPGRSHHAGDEVDAKVTYDYTDDVQLALFGGWFVPGRYYDEPAATFNRGDTTAWTGGGTATVKF